MKNVDHPVPPSGYNVLDNLKSLGEVINLTAVIETNDGEYNISYTKTNGVDKNPIITFEEKIHNFGVNILETIKKSKVTSCISNIFNRKCNTYSNKTYVPHKTLIYRKNILILNSTIYKELIELIFNTDLAKKERIKIKLNNFLHNKIANNWIYPEFDVPSLIIDDIKSHEIVESDYYQIQIHDSLDQLEAQNNNTLSLSREHVINFKEFIMDISDGGKLKKL